MNGCPSCVTTGSIGRMRLPHMRKPSTILTPTLLACLTVPPSGRYTRTVRGSLMDALVLFCMRHTLKSRCPWVDGCVSLPLQCMPIRRQSTVHPAAGCALTCSSQVKVAAWLQSSEDMDRCSKGEQPQLSRDLQLSWDSALCDVLMYYS